MFILSPTGLVLQYEQATPLGLIGREPMAITVAQSLPGQLFETGAPGRYDLSALAGDTGTIDGVFETGAAGVARPILYLRGGFGFANAYIKVWVNTTNRLLAQVTDNAGVVVATSQVASGALPAGHSVNFRLAWNCNGLLPIMLQSNYGSAYIDVDGTRPDWTVVSNTWTAWRPDFLFVGSNPGSPIGFNGLIRRIAVSPLEDPDAAQKTWSLPAPAVAPVLSSAQISHIGDLTILGLGIPSAPPYSTLVALTGTGAVTLTQSQISAAGGIVGVEIVIPASLIPGIDNNTNCKVDANGLGSNTVSCLLPTDMPTVSSATIGFDSGLVVVGTYYMSRTPSVSSIQIAGPGAVILTRAAVLAGGGTWSDSGIAIPSALVPGIDNTSTCAVTANAQATAPHAIVWPAAAPAVSAADIDHLGSLTIAGTGMFSTVPTSNSVVITGDGAVTKTAAQIISAGGTVGATSIMIPASIVPGITDSSHVKVHANFQDSNVQDCVLPSDVPTVSSATIGFDSGLCVSGTNYLSRTPSISSIDITAPGAVTLTKSDVETGGGTWSDSGIVIPSALVPGITDASTCSVTANTQATAYHAVTWPATAPTVSAADIAHLGDLTVTGTGMLSTDPASNSVIITGDGAVTKTAAQILAGGGTITAISIVIPAALVPGITDSSSAMVHANLQDSSAQGCALPSDTPTVSTASIGFDSGLSTSGTNYLSRTPSISSIDITAPGAVTLTKSDVETGGGSWSDTDISIPAALVPGIDNTSTCSVTANTQATAYHAITWPAAAPAVSTADIAHLGDLTIIGTGMLSTAPALNSVVITGGGAVTLSASDITTGGGTVGATSIVIPAALVPGIDGTSSVKVNANLQDSNVVVCSEPSDAPYVTPRVSLGLPAAVIVTPDLNLDIVGGNFLSRTPSISSIDITGPGAVNLTQAVVLAAAGGVWTDDHILIPVALVSSIDNTSVYALTSNVQTTAISPIGGPSSIDPPT